MTTYIICGLSGSIAIVASLSLWRNRIPLSVGAGLLSAMIYLVGAYGFVLPNMPQFQTSKRLAAELERFAPSSQSRDIHSPHYTEPSLVYHVGKDIDLKEHTLTLTNGKLVILNAHDGNAETQRSALVEDARTRGRCLQQSNPVTGFNYSRGAPLNLIILREGPC